MNTKKSFIVGTLALLMASSLYGAMEGEYKVNITQNLPYVDVDVMGEPVRIDRIQDPKHKLTNSYSKTSRPCPPFCVQPFQPVKGIETYGELELIDFLKQEVSNNRGVLVDARLPKWYKQGTIPGAINLPFSILNPNTSNQYLEQVLPILGAKKDGAKWNFDSAQKLVVFDNGPWDQQGTRAMQHLVKIGYPKDKIKYYRGGMQYWQILGFKVLKQQ